MSKLNDFRKNGNTQGRYLRDQVIITSSQNNLDSLVDHLKTGKTHNTRLTGDYGLTTKDVPKITVSDGHNFAAAQLQMPIENTPLTPVTEKELYIAFRVFYNTQSVVSRPFQINRQRESRNHAAHRISKALKSLNLTAKDEGFDVSPDHLVIGSWVQPGLSPWEIPARASGYNLEQGRYNMAHQTLWEQIGAKDRRNFKHKGAGTTVVIVDAAPEPGRLDPHLVDLHISMLAPDGEVEVNGNSNKVDLKEIYSMGRIRPQKLRFPGTHDIPAEDVEKYHGTLIASLVRQLAPDARIVLLEALNRHGFTTGSNLTEAMDYLLFLRAAKVTDNSRRRLVEDNLVINLSLGISRSLSEEAEAIYLLEACDRACDAGAVIVAAAGNDSYYLHSRNPEEPAAYGYYNDDYGAFRQVIAVSATNGKPGETALYSNQGNLGAPGLDLLMDTGDSKVKEGDRFIYWAGTSFATPLVAGAAALLLSAGVAPEHVKQRLWEHNTLQPKTWSQVPQLFIKDNLLVN